MANRLLLDTHIFIWWLGKNKRLSSEIGNKLKDPNNLVYLSVATVWEMVIKKSVGKLRHPPNLSKAIQTSGFKILPVELVHVLRLKELPTHHKDPFDRILIAQAISENLIFVTADPKIEKYNLPIFKA